MVSVTSVGCDEVVLYMINQSPFFNNSLYRSIFNCLISVAYNLFCFQYGLRFRHLVLIGPSSIVNYHCLRAAIGTANCDRPFSYPARFSCTCDFRSSAAHVITLQLYVSPRHSTKTTCLTPPHFLSQASTVPLQLGGCATLKCPLTLTLFYLQNQWSNQPSQI